MQNNKRPYIVIPYFVEQPTWGGRYILRSKRWDSRREFDTVKIGQSYELFSNTRLAVSLISTDEATLTPDSKDKLSPIEAEQAVDIEPGVVFPLIKFTQAKGNSFQLHRKPSVPDAHWKPKAESWYYFEPGKITFGIQKGANTQEYKSSCERINAEMKSLSAAVKTGSMTVADARDKMKQCIAHENPWQYVNVHYIPADGVVDLSGGGLHHSWEEDAKACPQGNVVYEVQQDVMDPECTLRSFDQGKIMDDGSIRTIHIDDYFRHLDTDEKKNTLTLSAGKDGILFNSPHYKLNKISLSNKTEMVAKDSFHHLFVKSGRIRVYGGGVSLTVGSGHSCFIPSETQYTLNPEEESVILQTYI